MLRRSFSTSTSVATTLLRQQQQKVVVSAATLSSSFRLLGDEGLTSTHFRDTNTHHPMQAELKVKRDTTSAASTSKVVPPCETVDCNGRTVAYDLHTHVHNDIWSEEECKAVKEVYRPRHNLMDHSAYATIQMVRLAFDIVSGYKFGKLTRGKILRRVLFLECAAAIPGLVGASLRHLKSVRNMQRDRGWINTLLEEASNERMHMLTAIKMYEKEYGRAPGLFFRAAVLVTQGLLWNALFIFYSISPRWVHRWVGHLEESAVHTYTDIIAHMESDLAENSDLKAFGAQPAPEIAIQYWKLKPTATVLDVIYQIRADECAHREVNHCKASLKHGSFNPFIDPNEAHRRVVNDGTCWDENNMIQQQAKLMNKDIKDNKEVVSGAGFSDEAKQELKKMSFGLPVQEGKALEKQVWSDVQKQHREAARDKKTLFTKSVSQ